MADFLYTLPDVVLFLLFSGGLTALFLGAQFVARRAGGLSPQKDDIDFGVRSQGTLFSVCSLILAFSLVQVESNLRHAQAAVASEAHQITTLDRALGRAGAADLAALRGPLRTYALSVARDEWPAMARGAASDTTASAYASFYGALLNATHGGDGAAIYTEILRGADRLSELREERVDAASLALPPIFWGVVAFTLGLFVLISAALAASAFRTLVVGCQSAVLGALLAVVFINDQPFKGQTSVAPTAFIKAVAAMDARRD